MLCRQHASDEEFLVFWENYESKNPDLGQLRSVHAKKNMRDAAECKAEFRVEKKKMISIGLPKPCKLQEH